jgi:hypothetical protein
VAAVAFHVLIIVACVAAYLRLPRKPVADLLAFLTVFIGSVAYFAAIVALFQPRYLTLFTRLAHPHGL